MNTSRLGACAIVTTLGAMAAIACGTSNDEVVVSADAGSDVLAGDVSADSSVDPADVGTGADANSELPDGEPPDAGPPPAPGGDTTSLPCGPAPCALPSQVCCSTRVPGSGGVLAMSCAAAPSCPMSGAGDGGGGGSRPRATTLSCTSALNCTQGQVCCIVAVDNVMSASCKTELDCDASPGTSAILCDPAKPTEGCPAGNPCSNLNNSDWRLLEGFGTCGGEGT